VVIKTDRSDKTEIKKFFFATDNRNEYAFL